MHAKCLPWGKGTIGISYSQEKAEGEINWMKIINKNPNSQKEAKSVKDKVLGWSKRYGLLTAGFPKVSGETLVLSSCMFKKQNRKRRFLPTSQAG